MVLTTFFTSTNIVHANTNNRNNGIELDDYSSYELIGDINDNKFTEIFYYENGTKIVYEHSINNERKTIVILDEDGTVDTVTYMFENEILK